MEVELELLADQILLSQHDWKMAVPEREEVFPLTRIESLAHLLDTTLTILAEAPLKLTAHMVTDIFVELIRGSFVALFVQILQDRMIYILLRCSKVI